MALNTYLTFDGNCREAFEFYRTVFNEEYEVFQTFGDGPEDMQVSNEDKDKVMHVSLSVGGGSLMGSDTTDEGPPFVMGNNFSLSYDANNSSEVDDLLAKLSDGGELTMPANRTFWGAYFGMCTDQFGINWMVMCES